MPLFHRDNRREPSVISRADRAREAGQWEAAAGLYRIALDRKPRNPPIWIQYGHALKEGGHRASAETAYRNAIAYQPDDPEAYLQLGHVLKLQGKMVEARLAYRCALVLDASLADAARELGQLKGDNLAAGQDGATAEAREFNQASLAAETVNPAVRRSLNRARGSFISRADRAREALQWDIAADLYRRALDRNPDNPPIWVQYGHALKESGNLAEAEGAYRAAIARNAGAAEPHLQLGHLLKMGRRCEEAQTAYLQALALQPSMTEPLPGLESLGWPKQQLTELTSFVTAESLRPEPRRPLPGDLAEGETPRRNIETWHGLRAPEKRPVRQLADALKNTMVLPPSHRQ